MPQCSLIAEVGGGMVLPYCRGMASLCLCTCSEISIVLVHNLLNSFVLV